MRCTITILIPALLVASCGPSQEEKKNQNAGKDDVVTNEGGTVNLPSPYATKSVVNYCEVIGWPVGKTPVAPAGFTISRFADSLENPRNIYIGSNGDVFVCESSGTNDLIKTAKTVMAGGGKAGNVEDNKSANRISLFRDTNGDGIPDMKTAFLTGLNHPFGMAIVGNAFYVANTDGVVMYPYKPGQTSITVASKKILSVPASPPGHWTRNLLASADGKKLYVSVGSGSNAGEKGLEKEERRANILEINVDGSGERIYGSGLRNPCGMAWAPGTNTLWTAVNERDELGDELVPDYLTSVKDGGFYGWPFSYWGQHEDPRLKDKQQPDMVKKAIVPDVSMGAHTASLGLAFDAQNKMAGKYAGGAFVGQHGSWNRSRLAGYAVVFVPFKGGRATGPMEPFLTGFVADSTAHKVYGRPVGVAFTPRGDMLVADDASNIVWRVSAAK